MNKQSPAWFERADRRLMKAYKYVSYIAMLCLIAIMLIAFIDVVGEKLAKAGLPVSGLNGYSEWIGFLHVPIVFLSAGFITLERGHTCVDILTNRLPYAVRRVTSYLSMVLGIAVCGFLTYRSFFFLLPDLIRFNTKIGSSSYSFPQWPFCVVYCIGLIMLTFSFVWALLRLCFHYTPPEAADPTSGPDSKGGDSV